MKTFFGLKESFIVEKTIELAGVTLQHMEHCPGAVAAFKRNLKDGASEADVAKAAQAVDNYLAIEDKAIQAGKASDADVEEMEKRIDKARALIDKLGLEGHTYHDMHLDRVEDMVEDDDEDFEDDDDDDDDDEDEDDDDEDKLKKEKKKMNEGIEDMMPASPDEKSMALRQAKFIEYVAEEIEEYLEQNRAFPEWMQNKLSALHQKAKDMHAVLAGEYEDDEEEMDESYWSVNEMGPRHTSKPMKSRFGGAVDSKKFDAYKKFVKQRNVDEPTVRMVIDNPNDAESKRMMKIANIAKAVELRKAAMKESISEKLSVSDGMGTWIDDFKKSDAPQFKDKSDKERRDMAIAAYLSAKKDKQEGYVSMAQQRAVWATRKDGGKGHPDNKKGKKK